MSRQLACQDENKTRGTPRPIGNLLCFKQEGKRKWAAQGLDARMSIKRRAFFGSKMNRNFK